MLCSFSPGGEGRVRLTVRVGDVSGLRATQGPSDGSRQTRKSVGRHSDSSTHQTL